MKLAENEPTERKQKALWDFFNAYFKEKYKLNLSRSSLTIHTYPIKYVLCSPEIKHQYQAFPELINLSQVGLQLKGNC